MIPSSSLLRPLKAMRQAFEIACGVVLVVFTCLVLYSVCMRYLFNQPPMWGEEIPKLLFVWLSFVGGALAYMLGYNICMTTLVERLTRRTAVAVELAMRAISLAMLLAIVWYSMPILQLASNKTVLATGLSDIWTYLPLTIGAALMAVNEVVRMTLAASGRSMGGEDGSLHQGL
jgi:TRAP-type C4-dicarboxylate transport system permease small subunit